MRKFSESSRVRYIKIIDYYNTMKQAIESIVESFKSFFGNTMPEEEYRKTIKVSNSKFGDFSFPCHKLAKELCHEGNENHIAEWTLENLDYDKNLFKKAEAVGPFINFFLNE